MILYGHKNTCNQSLDSIDNYGADTLTMITRRYKVIREVILQFKPDSNSI